MSDDGPRGESRLTAGDINAVVLAGGIGSRLRSVTATPKTIVPVEGKPFLVHLLDALKAKGIRRVVVCTGHGADEVENAVRQGNPGLDLAFSRETSPLGTGGALRRATGHTAAPYILAMNGDSWCDFDLASLLDFQRAHPMRPTLVATHVPDTDRFGQLELDAAGRILAFREKGQQPAPGWINAGLYLLPAAMLKDLPEGKSFSLEKEIMPLWIEAGFYAFRSEGQFLDIGTPESFALKETFMRLVIAAREKLP